MRPTVAGAIAIVLASKVKIGTSGSTTGTPPCVSKRGCHTGSSKPCDYDYTCPPPKECCSHGCCFRRSASTHPALPSSQIPPMPIPTPPHIHTTNLFSVVFWNHWYFWSLLALLLLSCSGGCSLWRRRREPSATRGVRRCHGRCGMASWPAMLGCAPADSSDPVSEPDSTGSCYLPPQYSRCSSFAQPPPYSEVTSKPDLYPVVISYSENNGKSGSYLMVQYLRNYFVAPGGASMSATSTADSISSTYVCTNNIEVPVAQPNGLTPISAPPPYATSAAVPTEAPSTPTSPPATPPEATATEQAERSPAPPIAQPESLRQSASMGSVSSVTTSRSCGSGTRETPSYSLSSEWTSGAVCGPGCSSGGCSTGCRAGCAAGRCRGDRFTRPASLGGGTVSEISSLLGLTSPGSPPMPTSPTEGNDPGNEDSSNELSRLLQQISALPSRESELWHQNQSTQPSVLSSFSKHSPSEWKALINRHRFWSSSAPTTPGVPQVPVIVPAQTPLIAAVMPGGNTSSMLLREATGVAADLH